MKTNLIFIQIVMISVFILQISQAQRITAGGWHSLAVCADSSVKAFGENATGQLGDGTTTDSNIPLTVAGLTGIVAVAAGGDQLEAHSMALKSDGTVWAWGSNLYGGLGNGSTTNSPAPIQSLLLSNITAISAGGWHSVALKNDGTVWVWGWNTDGQIGDGTTVDKTIATQVPGLAGITAISAGTYHVLALKNDGTVWAWGDNVSGQIGDGSNTDRTSPVQVTGLTNVVKISAGRFFSLAIKNDGTVWTWGENLYGQLGNGTTTDSNVPVQIPGLSDITSATVSTGAFHCMVEKNDNTVWSWGRNTYGNLGNNTVVNSSSPVQVVGISDVAGMSAGTNFTLAYKNDGTFWGCGRNGSGQLGDGTVLQRNTLTQSTLLCSLVVTSLEDEISSIFKQIHVYPNPLIGGEFTIELSNPFTASTFCKIDVYDLRGTLIKHADVKFSNGKTLYSMSLADFSDGIYQLKITSNNQQFVQKLIK